MHEKVFYKRVKYLLKYENDEIMKKINKLNIYNVCLFNEQGVLDYNKFKADCVNTVLCFDENSKGEATEFYFLISYFVGLRNVANFVPYGL